MSRGLNNLYRFGDFRLDSRERLLWRGEDLVPLPPKAYEVLCRLIEGRGKIVSKDELMTAVWAETFVEEGNLPQNIYILRRALGKNDNGTDFIETVPRRGYRFAAPVSVVEQTARSDDRAAGNGFLQASNDTQIFSENKALPEPNAVNQKTQIKISENFARKSFFILDIVAFLALSAIIVRFYSEKPARIRRLAQIFERRENRKNKLARSRFAEQLFTAFAGRKISRFSKPRGKHCRPRTDFSNRRDLDR